MGFYGQGMSQAQALGQGTFTFDRIAPNRYLLDSFVNEDRVLPGRYSLVEYTHPIAVVKGSFLQVTTPMTIIINDHTETQYIVSYTYDFKYDPSSKIYDILPVDGTGKISMNGTKKIFISVFDGDDKYHFYYANLPNSESNSELNQTTEKIIHNWDLYTLDGEESISIFSFNKEVDKAYAAISNDDIVMQNESEGWDSTAWLKIVQHEFDEEDKPTKSIFKYINVANLNVLTPSFNVLSNTATDLAIIELINTFASYDNSATPATATFNAPQIKQGQNATFNIRYPNPMDINIALDTAASEESATATFEYTYTGKNYTLKLPEIGNVINATTTAINATTAVLDLIKYPRNGSFWPQDGGNPPDVNTITGSTDITGAGKIWEAIKAAKSVAGTGQANVINSIGTNGITVSIGGSTTLTNGKLNIETTINESRIITASNISNLWNYGTLTAQQNNP